MHILASHSRFVLRIDFCPLFATVCAKGRLITTVDVIPSNKTNTSDLAELFFIN